VAGSWETIAKFEEMKARIDVVICEAAQVPVVEDSGEFVKRVVLSSENVPRMWIYARDEIEMPALAVDIGELNRAFDQRRYWNTTIWPH